MTRNHVSSDSEPSPPNPTFLSNFLASGCPPTLPVSDVPVQTECTHMQRTIEGRNNIWWFSRHVYDYVGSSNLRVDTVLVKNDDSLFY